MNADMRNQIRWISLVNLLVQKGIISEKEVAEENSVDYFMHLLIKHKDLSAQDVKDHLSVTTKMVHTIYVTMKNKESHTIENAKQVVAQLRSMDDSSHKFEKLINSFEKELLILCKLQACKNAKPNSDIVNVDFHVKLIESLLSILEQKGFVSVEEIFGISSADDFIDLLIKHEKLSIQDVKNHMSVVAEMVHRIYTMLISTPKESITFEKINQTIDQLKTMVPAHRFENLISSIEGELFQFIEN